MKNTQLKMIKDQLLSTGEVSRNWCLARYCSRLGARIMDLKKEGWTFTTEKREGDYVYKAAHIPKLERLVKVFEVVSKANWEMNDTGKKKVAEAVREAKLFNESLFA